MRRNDPLPLLFIRDNYHLAESTEIALSDPPFYYAVDGIEGQNEYDSSSVNIYPQLAQYTREVAALRSSVFGESAIQHFPLTLCTLQDWFNLYPGFQRTHSRLSANLYPYINFSNHHHYPVNHTTGDYSPGLEAEARVDHIRGVRACADSGRLRKLMVTEVNTFGDPKGMGTERAKAMDVARYCCEFFRMKDSNGERKVEKIYLFSLFGEWWNEIDGVRDAKRLAFVRANYSETQPSLPVSVTKQPAYYALKSFLDLLRQKEFDVRTRRWVIAEGGDDVLNDLEMGVKLPADLDPVQAKLIKWQLFQKEPKNYLLAIWRDGPAFNRAENVDHDSPPTPVKVTIKGENPTLTHLRLDASAAEPQWNYKIERLTTVSEPQGYCVASQMPVFDAVSFLEIRLP